MFFRSKETFCNKNEKKYLFVMMYILFVLLFKYYVVFSAKMQKMEYC